MFMLVHKEHLTYIRAGTSIDEDRRKYEIASEE